MLYDFEDDGGPGGGGATTTRDDVTSAQASSGGQEATGTATASTITTTVTAGPGSSGTGSDPWACTTSEDCFGGVCAVDGACAPRTVELGGVGRSLYVDASEPSVAVVIEHLGQFPGIRVATVRATGQTMESANIVNDVSAQTSFVARDADEIVMPMPVEMTARQYYQSGWGGPADLVKAPPLGTGNVPLNGVLSSEHGWLGLAGSSFVQMTPAPQSTSWMFGLQPIGAAGAAQGHSLVHHAGDRYVFSMFVSSSATGCLGVADYGGGGWTTECRVPQIRAATGIASDGQRVAVRMSDAASVEDVVAVWDPDTGSLEPIARTPFVGRQSVAIDGDFVYFDGVIDATTQALFRCAKDADPAIAPQLNGACKQILDAVSADGKMPAVTSLGSVRLERGTPNERSLVCWVIGSQLTCQVRR